MPAFSCFHFSKSGRLLLTNVLSGSVSNGSKYSGFKMAGSGSFDRKHLEMNISVYLD